MYDHLVEKFRDKLCRNCDKQEMCHKKPSKMVKCGIFYLVDKVK